MSIQQDIERQERDFQDLLDKVMRAPLDPISQSIKALEERLEQVETMLQDVRDVDLTGLSLSLEDTVKKVDTVRSISRDAPRELGSKVQSLLEQLRVELEQGVLHKTHALIQQHSVQFEGVADQVVNRLTAVTDAVSDSRAALDLTLQQNVAYLEGAIQSRSEEIATRVQHATEHLSGIAVQHEASHLQLFERLHESIKHDAAAFQQEVTAKHERVDQQILALGESITATQDMLARQANQLDTFREQHNTLAEQLREQVTQTTERLRTWLIVVACLGGVSAVSAATVIAGKF